MDKTNYVKETKLEERNDTRVTCDCTKQKYFGAFDIFADQADEIDL